MPSRGRATAALAAGLCLVATIGCEPGSPVQPAADAAATGQATAPGQNCRAAASPTATRDISFDDIAFEMEKGAPFTRGLLPARVTDLAGSRIRIRGYILPSFQQSGLTQFVLVRDNMECCFGPGAALYDCIVVSMRPGRSTDFSVRPVAVTGIFSLKELKGPDGKHLAIYALEGEEVR